MRTLKKLLATTVALATMFSLTATAAFNDEAGINSDLVADVELLTALNIIKGDTQGNFNPEKTITRAEAAKMVYVLKMKGNDDGAAGWAGASTFTDTKWHWAEGYIAYCANVGIIDGVGNGRFNPEGQVTAAELAKMLLVVAGYRNDYTGFTWQQAVIADGMDSGLFDEYDLAYSAAAPRQWAAKLFTNTINVVKKPVYIMGEIVSYGPTFGQSNLEMVTTEGIVTATRDIELDATPANNENGDNRYSKIKVDSDTYLLDYDIPDSLLGQKVTVITKGEPSTSQSNDVKVYGVSAVQSTFTEVALDAISGKTTGGKYVVTIDGQEYSYADGNVELTTYVNYAPATARKISELCNINSSDLVKLVDSDDDGLFDTALVTETAFAQVTQINPDRNIFRTNDSTGDDISVSTAEDFAQYNFLDSIQKDDIIAITPNYTSGSERFDVSLASMIEGTVESFGVDGDGNITSVNIDGKTYEFASTNMFAGGKYTDAMTSHEYYFTDGKYIVFSTGELTASAEDQSNVAFVIDVAKVQNTDSFGNPIADSFALKVQILKNDGSNEIVEYFVPASNADGAIGTNENNGKDNYDAVNALKGKLVEYVMRDGKVFFKNLATVSGGDLTVKTATGVLRYDPSTGRVIDATMSASSVQTSKPSYMTDEKSYFFIESVEDGEKVYSVVKASELKGVTTGTTTGVQLSVTSGMPTLRYGLIVLDSAIPGESVSGNIALGSDSYTISRDTDRWVIKYTVTGIGGEEKVLTMHGSLSDYSTLQNVSTRMKSFNGKLIEYSEIDGVIDLLSGVKIGLTGFNQGTLTGYSDGTAYINGFYTVDEDTAIVYVDVDQTVGDDASKAVITSGSGLPVAGKYGENLENTYQNNVYYKLVDGTSRIETIFVEIDGETLTGANGIF